MTTLRGKSKIRRQEKTNYRIGQKGQAKPSDCPLEHFQYSGPSLSASFSSPAFAHPLARCGLYKKVLSIGHGAQNPASVFSFARIQVGGAIGRSRRSRRPLPTTVVYSRFRVYSQSKTKRVLHRLTWERRGTPVITVGCSFCSTPSFLPSFQLDYVRKGIEVT